VSQYHPFRQNKKTLLSLKTHAYVYISLNSIKNDQTLRLKNLRTLDLSCNNINQLPNKLSILKNIKSLNLESNKLYNLRPISELSNLQNLSAGKNKLGQLPQHTNSSTSSTQQVPLPALPQSLKQIKLEFNNFTSIPKPLLSPTLTKLTKLDLSNNDLASVPSSIANLVALTELNLSHNSIPQLCPEISKLQNLKSLSLEYNAIQVSNANIKWSEKNPQPLPKGLFEDTQIIDLNLKGNKINNTQLNDFDGFQVFLDRRQKLKSKNIYGGALTDLSVCGLD